ncbi:DUF6297 family protein [Symbioplanes lichenis]|uniref:DUF6297 family protein n=1 Tax=Symbioplanes lichenis TaxID=1629072 RepID=UPI00273A45CC|nr:DUF6297 family protein [Actinoplanes lichenis]
MTTLVSAGEVRRWIGRTQRAHSSRWEIADNWYFAVLFVAIVGGMVHKQLAAVFWPTHPNASQLAGVSLVLTMLGGLYLLLRRFGPLAISRPAASWLLTAPMSRRALLLPGLGSALAVSALTGAVAALAVEGHVLARPPASLFPVAGALAAATLLLIALAAQADRWWSRWSDRLAALVLAAGLAGLVADSAVTAPPAPAGWPTPQAVVTATGALAVIVAAGFLVSVRNLARTPNDRILESARTAGTLWDSAYAIEPSFVSDMVERRYWSRRHLRSRRLSGRVPVLVAQDLLMLRRRPARLLWLAGSAALPALVTTAPRLVLAAVVLIGGLLAGGVTTATLRTDTGNPFMLRMLGIDSRTAILQRAAVPVTLATLWYALSLTILMLLGDLPAGPWWLLGVALGPVGAVAAVRKARAGFVDNGLMPFDTPMGSVSTGPLIAALAGVDMLVLGVPALVLIAQNQPLSWTAVLVQAVITAAGCRLYLSATTAQDRVELA